MYFVSLASSLFLERLKTFHVNLFNVLLVKKASVEIPPDPAHGTAYCIDFGWNIICKVQCENGYTPKKEHASFYEYNKVTNEWTPGGDEFPWADCV